MSNDKKYFPLAYVRVYAFMAERARELGYALTIHGSLMRDCDMVAIPWTKEAVATDVFVREMIDVSGGTLAPDDFHSAKPHGRLAWAICLAAPYYIDLSVMPRTPVDPEPTF